MKRDLSVNNNFTSSGQKIRFFQIDFGEREKENSIHCRRNYLKSDPVSMDKYHKAVFDLTYQLEQKKRYQKRMCYKAVFFILVLCWLSLPAYSQGQETSPAAPSVTEPDHLTYTEYSQSSGTTPALPAFEELVKVPRSPEAHAFQKYGNAPISYFDGSPNINIPIAELKGREISIPVNLTYDASGIKVDQISTDAGLGWNLKVGGMIVRKVNGLPDDYITATPSYYPYYSTAIFPGSSSISVRDQYDYFKNNNLANGSYVPKNTAVTDWNLQWPVRYVRFMDEVSKGYIDSQPDTYSLSVNGISGTLVIDYHTSTGYCIEYPEIKVQPSLSAGPGVGVRQINGWQIIDGEGNVYQFGGSNAQETTYYYENNSLEVSRNYTSAWKLTSIVSGKLKERATFTYTPESWTNDQPIISYYALSNNYSMGCPFPSYIINMSPYYRITSSQLSSIKFDTESGTRFSIVRKPRLDLPGQSAIDYLRINNEYGLAINYVKFNTDYFSTGTTHLEKRLKLNSLGFQGDILTNPNPLVYSFSYNPVPLPSRDSKARDYYGYYNGQVHNATLIPHNAQFGDGAMREVNSAYTQAGMLESIVYPTKGSTLFSYQPNNELVYPTTSTWQNAASFSWTSGTPESYCDDIVGTSLNVQYYQFTAPLTTDYKITFTKNVDNNSQVQLVALYQGIKTLCDLAWENGPDIIYRQYSVAANDETFVTLQANTTYRVAMANNTNLNAAMSLTVSYLQQGRPQYVDAGGVRISKIEDYSAPGQLAKRRYIYYNDASALSGQSIVNLVNNGKYNTSGINQNRAQFERAYTMQSFDNNNYVNCSYLERFGASFMNGNGRNFTFSKVSEIETNGTGEVQLKVYEFHNKNESTATPFISGDLRLGKVATEKVYRYDNVGQSFNLLQETVNTYALTDLSATHNNNLAMYFYTSGSFYNNLVVLGGASDPNLIAWDYQQMVLAGFVGPIQPQGCNVSSAYQVYCIKNGPTPLTYLIRVGGYGKKFDQLVQTRTTVYSGITPYITTQNFVYNTSSNFQLSEITQNNSNGDLIRDTFAFPTAQNNPALFNQNRLTELTKTQRFVNSQNVLEKTVYFSVYNSNQILPQRIEEKINAVNPKDVLKIISYDPLGNIREATQRDGIPISYIWGYGGSKIVLEVVGATYPEVLSALGGTVTFGDANRNFTQAQMTALRNNLPKGLASHYIFNSQHGLTRLSDQNGLNTDYSYDSFGRLTNVKDHNGHVVESYTYNYKN